jgi:hypothetical protein
MDSISVPKVLPPICPSARPESIDSIAFGIVLGSIEEPRVTYFPEPLAVNDQLLALAQPVTPTEIFRFAALCIKNGCQYFNGTDCLLVERIVSQSPQVVDALPPCNIRTDCRWWQQEGKAACFRCPQIVTDRYISSDSSHALAIPDPEEQLPMPASS